MDCVWLLYCLSVWLFFLRCCSFFEMVFIAFENDRAFILRRECFLFSSGIGITLKTAAADCVHGFEVYELAALWVVLCCKVIRRVFLELKTCKLYGVAGICSFCKQQSRDNEKQKNSHYFFSTRLLKSFALRWTFIFSFFHCRIVFLWFWWFTIVI